MAVGDIQPVVSEKHSTSVFLRAKQAYLSKTQALRSVSSKHNKYLSPTHAHLEKDALRQASLYATPHDRDLALTPLQDRLRRENSTTTDLESTTITPARREEIIRTAFMEEYLTLEALTPLRIKSAWRITRLLAMLFGLCAEDEALSDALFSGEYNTAHFGLDKWVWPNRYRPEKTLPTTRHGMHGLRGYLARETVNRPVPLLPPPIPPEYIDNTTEKAHWTYDPQNDERLQAWCEVIGRAGLELRMADTDEGRYGLMGLVEPHRCRLAWPTPNEIVSFESMLIEDMTREAVELGGYEGANKIMERYDLRRHEAQGMLYVAKAKTTQAFVSDLEQERAFMVAALDEFIKRAKQGCNLREELAAIKQKAIVLGINKAEAENAVTDFINVVKNYTQQYASEEPTKYIDHDTPRPQSSSPGYTPTLDAMEALDR